MKGFHMSKPKKPDDAPKPLRVTAGPDADMEKLKADLTLSPCLNAGMVIEAFAGNLLGNHMADITEVVDSLRDSTRKAREGDLSTLESMLISQATALQTIFSSYARRAQAQTQQRHLEAFMGMALKAQAQSRATIQAVIELKYPRQATFVKQQNVAHQQQVNNGPAPTGGIAYAQNPNPSKTNF